MSCWTASLVRHETRSPYDAMPMIPMHGDLNWATSTSTIYILRSRPKGRTCVSKIPIRTTVFVIQSWLAGWLGWPAPGVLRTRIVDVPANVIPHTNNPARWFGSCPQPVDAK